MTAEPAPVDSLTFEAALAELEDIVRSLEGGQTALADSITAYERGAALKKHCEAKLAEAQARIETISVAPDGSVNTEPFETGE